MFRFSLLKTDSSSATTRLQLELHSRILKDSDRYSILLNNCAVITMLDWLIRLKSFFVTYVNENDLKNPDRVIKKLELKFNLTNTDFFLVETTENPMASMSQAVILRVTAFLEYNQKKMFKPLQSCVQSIQIFSCQTNSIEETALSILDPAMLTINLLSKNSFFSSNNPEDNETPVAVSNGETFKFLFDVSTDALQLKFSYLDIKLFMKIVENLKAQLDRQDKMSWHDQVALDLVNSANDKKQDTNWIISDINLTMNNFLILVIDDCMDIDIPLLELQFYRLRIIQSTDKSLDIFSVGHGSSEFALNISYYNRLLSGWEPLLEPWLSRFDWKLKAAKKCFTLTSMDVLNMNISNPLIDLMLSVFANWKEDYFKNRQSKYQKVFQPYKLINSSGQTIKFRFFKSDSTTTGIFNFSV